MSLPTALLNGSKKLEFPISERFTSLQGEGQNVGAPEYFIRLAGCNLATLHGGCKYCDTAYAQRKEQGELISLETLLDEAPCGYPGRVCVTGGEPLWHKGVSALLNGLLGRGNFVMVETNGSLLLPRRLPGGRGGIAVHAGVSFSMDIKCPGSGMAKYNRFENISRLDWYDQLKFVIVDRTDFDYAKGVLREYPCRAPVFFQPAYGMLEPRELAEWILKDKLSVRLSLQQHKTLWGQKRGV